MPNHEQKVGLIGNSEKRKTNARANSVLFDVGHSFDLYNQKDLH